MMENNKGITLISLTIMIVVLLILAAIGANYNSTSIKYAKLTKLISEFEIINTQISILKQNKNYQAEYTNYGLDETKDAELISKIDSLLEDKLTNVYNIKEAHINAYKYTFQYCSKDNIDKKLEIDGIEGNYLVNIQNRMVISFDGIKYNGKMYHTLEELEQDGLATNTYKVEYYGHENPYIPQGHYYIGGTWDTGYIIGDSQDDKHSGNQVKVLTPQMVEEYVGNLYMWIPIQEKSDSNINGIDWVSVTSETDYTNIQSALDAYKTTYTAPEYSSEWYKTDNAQYAYNNTQNQLIEFPTTTPTEENKNNLLSSIYLNSGLYIKIHEAKYVEIKPEPDPQPGTLPSGYQQVEYIQSTGTQYIDTGYKIAENSKLQVDIAIESENIMGFSDLNNSWYAVLRYDRCSFLSSNDVYYTSSILNERKTVTLSKEQGVVDDNVFYENFNVGTTRSEYTFHLFAAKISWSTQLDFMKCKLYSFKVWEDNVLIMDFVPCYRKSDNVAGMYDTVNDIFYTNSGTGNFQVSNEEY